MVLNHGSHFPAFCTTFPYSGNNFRITLSINSIPYVFIKCLSMLGRWFFWSSQKKIVCPSSQIRMNSSLLTFDRAVSPFHMETIALLMAIQAAATLEIENCVFMSDSELLVSTLHPKTSTETLQPADLAFIFRTGTHNIPPEITSIIPLFLHTKRKESKSPFTY